VDFRPNRYLELHDAKNRESNGEAHTHTTQGLVVGKSLPPGELTTPGDFVCFLENVDLADKKKTFRGLRMNADIGDDPTKRSLFPVLDLSLESLGPLCWPASGRR